MFELIDLLEYGEIHIYNCERFYYIELSLEIPADGVSMLAARAKTLRQAIDRLRANLDDFRSPKPSRRSRSPRNSDTQRHQNGE